jgi:hypothetical protein
VALRLSALTVALVAGLVAGCGGSGGDSSATDTAPVSPLSKQDFIQSADQICAERDKLVYQQVGRAAAGQLSGAKLARFVNGTLIPHAQLAIDRLRTLPPPPGDDEKVTAFLDAAQQGVDRLGKDPTLIEGDRAFARSERLARAYGLKTCARG